MDYYVYILQCKDNSYYIGVTNNIDRRVAEHNEGIDIKSYTFSRRPVKIVYSEKYPEPYPAICREKQLKGWRRAKKEALIFGQYDDLPKLAQRS